MFPEKIEERLSKIISGRFFVTGISDDILGERLVLVMEETNLDVGEDFYLSEIRKLSSLQKYEVPKEVYFVDEFHETETKKVVRAKTLKKIYKK